MLPDASIFLPDTPILEIVLRGTVVYLALFFLLRVTLKRESGEVGITNLLLIVLIADAALNAMAADYRSIADGLFLVATIVFWSLALDWLGFRVPWVGRFVHPRPLPLVVDGRPLRRNLRKELITDEELLSQVRLQGVDRVEDVEYAYMEGNGAISVVPRDRRANGRASLTRT